MGRTFPEPVGTEVCQCPSTARPPRLPPQPTCRAEAEACCLPTLTHPVWNSLTSPTLCVTDHCLVCASEAQPSKRGGLFVAGFSHFLVFFRVLSFYAFTKVFPKTHTLTLCFYSLFLPDNTHKAVKRGLSTSHLPLTMTASVSVLTSFQIPKEKAIFPISLAWTITPAEPGGLSVRLSQTIFLLQVPTPLSQVYTLKSSCVAIRNVPVPATPEVVAKGTGSCNILSSGKRQRTDIKRAQAPGGGGARL